MNNIFENAYFGKEYKTRDGRKAIYVRDTMMHRVFVHELILEDGLITCSKHGKIQVTDHELDIISEWEEEISEEQLNNIASKEAHKWYDTVKDETTYDFWRECFECYKSGYKAAKKGE